MNSFCFPTSLFDSFRRHRLAFFVGFAGSLLSFAGFIALQLDFWLTQFYFLINVEWQAWTVLILGLLITTLASTTLYLHLNHSNKLADYAMQLERSNRDLDSFASIASHDLKEPLRTIQSYTELTLRREEFTERGQHYLDTVCEAAIHMQDMLHHIRQYARLGAKVDKLDEIVAMDSTFQQVTTNLRHLIDKRDAEITCNNLPQTMGSRVQILQLLQNLIANAIHYCPKDRQPKINLTATEMADGWEFALSDNGEGIPADAHEKIFKPFKRHSRQKVAGSGLGLSICQRIVHAHCGTIYCKSNAPTGTIFIFTLKKDYPQ